MSELISGAALSERVGAAGAVGLAAEVLAGHDGWIVGGAVRAAALGEEVGDVDLTVPGDAEAVAREVAERGNGHAFLLSTEFGNWRVVARDGRWGMDVVPLRGDGIEADLAVRDFTVGAVAVPLSGGPPIDPHGGLTDLASGVLRAVSPQSFADDPLRVIRAARIAAAHELEPDAGTVSQARAVGSRVGEPAGERQFAELRLLVGGPDPLRGLELMDRLGATEAVLPELHQLRGVVQNPNHHLDVHGHTLAVLERWLEVEADLERFAGERAEDAAALLAEPLADEIDRRTALRFGALTHDMGKPATRAEQGGYVTFIGHDRVGVGVIAGLCDRLRTSRRLCAHLQGLARHHLRLGFLVHERPLPLRRIHQYLRKTDPVSADVTLLTVADRMAARGEGPLASDEMIGAHLDLAREMLGIALDWRRDGPPAPLLRGDDLARRLGIEPGPALAPLLAELEAAQYADEISDADEAAELAKRLFSEPNSLPPQ